MWQHCYTCAKESIIFVANTRAPFRSIIFNIISFRWFFASVVVIVVTRRRHSLSTSLFLFLSLSYLSTLLYVSIFVSLNFLKIFLSISNRLFSSVSVRNFLSRAMYFLCIYTHTRARAHTHTYTPNTCCRVVYFRSLVLVSYVSVSERCLFCTDILHRR